MPPEKKPINCKWVYKVKYKSDGNIEHFKARLVVCGGHQLEGFDFNGTCTPVAKMASATVLLSVVVAKRWELHQMDVHNAVLDGDLHEEVDMWLPPSFTTSSPNKV